MLSLPATQSSLVSNLFKDSAVKVSRFATENESKEYQACRFELNGKRIICRTAKVTPTKTGQFVTFWKRNGRVPIEPFEENDPFDFLLVIVSTDEQFGFLVFPKSNLIEEGLVSTELKEGKRAFRVYPPWDVVQSKQAIKTQKWQTKHFYDLATLEDRDRLNELF